MQFDVVAREREIEWGMVGVCARSGKDANDKPARESVLKVRRRRVGKSAGKCKCSQVKRSVTRLFTNPIVACQVSMKDRCCPVV